MPWALHQGGLKNSLAVAPRVWWLGDAGVNGLCGGMAFFTVLCLIEEGFLVRAVDLSEEERGNLGWVIGAFQTGGLWGGTIKHWSGSEQKSKQHKSIRGSTLSEVPKIQRIYLSQGMCFQECMHVLAYFVFTWQYHSVVQLHNNITAKLQSVTGFIAILVILSNLGNLFLFFPNSLAGVIWMSN